MEIDTVETDMRLVDENSTMDSWTGKNRDAYTNGSTGTTQRYVVR